MAPSGRAVRGDLRRVPWAAVEEGFSGERRRDRAESRARGWGAGGSSARLDALGASKPKTRAAANGRKRPWSARADGAARGWQFGDFAWAFGDYFRRCGLPRRLGFDEEAVYRFPLLMAEPVYLRRGRVRDLPAAVEPKF
ncbi:hypothetical protein GUJ93_ZPchr0006g42163 [Zizania palustris]|uniref:Uncharacterized protein n=1 Tax=Zizania palustris TaxID=103762 RepID=A0A8J5VUG6_ZIZPA|nr:hypothetical protein GUJ93_ZPchr0006g42163 [Zizania palustris]